MMISKILPILLMLIGTGMGIGTGLVLSDSQSKQASESQHSDEYGDKEKDTSEFTKMLNQFVIPIVRGDKVTSMVVMSLSLETKVGLREKVYAREPKLRDLFLRVLFDHANMGGFRGAFTQPENMDLLRTALREAAQKEMGADIRNVLIVDIAREDS